MDGGRRKRRRISHQPGNGDEIFTSFSSPLLLLFLFLLQLLHLFLLLLFLHPLLLLPLLCLSTVNQESAEQERRLGSDAAAATLERPRDEEPACQRWRSDTSDSSILSDLPTPPYPIPPRKNKPKKKLAKAVRFREQKTFYKLLFSTFSFQRG